MGIKRMNGFIHRYRVRQLDDFELHHATLIIDGSELFYHLYFDQDNGRRGGEYSSFRMVINDFFDTLINRCNVQCYVVFDRFKSESNIPRYVQMRTKKLQGMTKIIEGRVMESGHRAQPVLGKDVLKQTLHELSVPYIVVPGDADAELAAIANKMDGYVLATDTDFCVFDVARGFLPLDDFRWRDAKEKCRCKIFHQRTLEKTFRIPKRAIAFLEPLLSNQDDIQVDFSLFFRSISGDGRRNRQNQQRSKFYWRPDELESVLIWLGKEYRNDDNAIGYIRRHVPTLPEQEFRKCLDIYRNQPDVAVFVQDLLDGGHSLGVLTQCFNVFGDPETLADFLPLVPDDRARPSANKIASAIRYATYQIGIMKDAARDPGEDFQILVTDRCDQKYAADFVKVRVDKSELEPMLLELDEDVIRKRDDMLDIMTLREKYILNVLSRSGNHGFVENFSNETKLLAATFKYWSSSSDDEERHVDEAVKALAFTLSATYYESDLFDEITETSDAVFNKTALHSSSQWLCCVKDATVLNVALGKPLECIVMGRLFSGILYQKAYSYFVCIDDVEDEQADLFGNNADAQLFYENLLELAPK